MASVDLFEGYPGVKFAVWNKASVADLSALVSVPAWHVRRADELVHLTLPEAFWALIFVCCKNVVAGEGSLERERLIRNPERWTGEHGNRRLTPTILETQSCIATRSSRSAASNFTPTVAFTLDRLRCRRFQKGVSDWADVLRMRIKPEGSNLSPGICDLASSSRHP